MALTIHQYPTSPNLADNDLLFSLTSTQVAQPQFQYVCDIKDESNNLIQRIKQQPNPSGKAVFNVGQIVVNSLGSTDAVWEIAQATTQSECGKDFKIYFGEEYGSSVSSSITLYNGYGPAGSPATTSSLEYYFNLDGVLNPQQKVNWNWASGSKLDYQATSGTTTFNHSNGLTSFPTTQSIRLTDYHTISFLNGNVAGDAPNASSAQDVFAYRVRSYDATGSIIDDYFNYNEAGPRTLSNQNWASIYTNQNENTRLIHFPAGPANFDEMSQTLSEDTAYYVMDFYGQDSGATINTNGVWGSYRFNIVPADCGYEGVRFAWKNIYGVWDYYNFSLAESRVSNVSRLTYEQTFVPYSTTTNTAVYDNTRRGSVNFYNDITKVRTAESDWLTQSEADVLRELFFSANVYVYTSEYGFIPVVITNASITEKTNPRTQKLFKYTAEYQYANKQQARLF